MKLLITTQVVDREDPTLGFFHRWIEEFAKHCESIEVICLYEGEHTLPENVHVHSLGKEQRTGKGKTRFGSLSYSLRFVSLIRRLRNDYDAVFVHMNPEYVVLGGLWWRTWHKKIGLWYLHKSVTIRLRIAELFANVIFTASKKSFRLPSKKVQIVGHGIDVTEFENQVTTEQNQENTPHHNLRILTTGRIAPSKRIIEMLQAMDELHARGVSFTFTIAGGAGTPEDASYVRYVQEQIAQKPYKDAVVFMGPVSHDKIPKLLADADVFLNLSTTGSIDKAVFEAFAAGKPAVSSNVAFRELLEPYGLYISAENSETRKAGEIANALEHAESVDARVFQKYVQENHSLERLIPIILKELC